MISSGIRGRTPVSPAAGNLLFGRSAPVVAFVDSKRIDRLTGQLFLPQLREKARNRPKCLYDFAAKKTPRFPAVSFSGEMRTRSQFKCAFSPDGAKKKPRDGSAGKNARDPGGLLSGNMCTMSQFECAFIPDGARKKPRGGFAGKNARVPGGLVSGEIRTRLQS